MGQNLMSRRIARSFASLPQAHMLRPEQLITFGSGPLNSRYSTRSFTARKVFCFGTSTFICEAYRLQCASSTKFDKSVCHGDNIQLRVNQEILCHLVCIRIS